MEKLSGKDLARLVSDYINVLNTDDKCEDFVKHFSRQHRTLQQSTIGLFLKVIEHVASDEFSTDARNEDSKRTCKALIDGFKVIKKEEFLKDNWSEASADDYLNKEGGRPSKYLGFI